MQADNEYRAEEISESTSFLVCLSSSPSSKEVIQAGANMAQALNLPWTAIYVRTGSYIKLSDTDKRTLQNNMNLVEYLGGKLVTVNGNSVAEEIMRFSERKDIQHIVLGKNSGVKRKGILETILQVNPHLNIHVIPSTGYFTSDINKPKRKNPDLYQEKKVSLKSVLITLGIFVVTVGIGILFYATGFNDANIIMIFLLAVLFVSISAGRIPGLAASLLSVLMFNFLFTEPRFTFAVNETQYLITFPVMLIVSLTASELTVRLKRESVNSAVREKRTEFLYNVSRRLLKTIGTEKIIITVAEFLEKFMNHKIVCLLADTEGGIQPFYPAEGTLSLSTQELNAADWSFRHNISAGHGTDIMEEARGFYVPLSSRNLHFGVIGILCEEQGEEPDFNQRSLLEAVAAQLSVALDRERLYKEQEKIQIEIEREKMHSNLLRSISHDLRTPLAAIAGASSTLLSGKDKIAGKDQKRLLTDIVNDATWLTQLVENLLSLTRAEEGQLGVSKELEVVEEVVLSAVERVKSRFTRHSLHTVLTDEPFMAPMDAGLIQQVLTNLLDNAIRYTPAHSTITIRTVNKSFEAVFEVEDNGPGIPENSIPNIFNRFVTVHESTGRERRGLGLGLAICKSIVEAHNGTIEVENAIPRGAVFRFSLPIPKNDIEQSHT